MKIRLSIYHSLCLLCLIGVTTLMGGCTQEITESPDQPKYTEGNIICISTRAVSTKAGSTAENAIRTLRVVVFDTKNGGVLLNKFYETSKAVSTKPDGYSYFLKNALGEYQISELLPKTTIKVMMIANELTTLNIADNATPDAVKETLLNFTDRYQTSSGSLDIAIAGTSTSSNIGYIPMFAETESLIPNDWDGVSGKVIPMDLVRTLAKVTFQITDLDTNTDPLFNSGTLTINSASIVRVPQTELLGTPSEYTGIHTSTAIKEFKTKVTSDLSTLTTQSDQLVFYIPEYIVSDKNKTDGSYSYVQLNATYKATANGTETNSTYKILLGDGMAEFYKNGGPTKDNLDQEVAKLPKEDFNISRNKNYDYKVTVGSTGTLSLMKVSVAITPWTEQVVAGDIDKPCLNVSSIRFDKVRDTPIRIYFWTNVSDLKVEDKAMWCLYYNAPDDWYSVDMKWVAQYNITTYKTNDDLVYPYNGYIDFTLEQTFNRNYGLKLTLNAGGLKRTITVITVATGSN